MSSATMRCETFPSERLPETQPRRESAVTFDSGVYRVAARRGHDARNVLASLRVNVDFVRSVLRDVASDNVLDALDDVFEAAARLEGIVADIDR